MKAYRSACVAMCLLLSGCNLFDSKLLSKCEVLLKERLQSPSGYKRIGVNEYNELTTFDKLLKDSNFMPEILSWSSEMFKTYKELYDKAVLLKVYIDYDAPNGFGTPVRGLAMCEYVSRVERTDDIDDFRVKLNGKTEIQYLQNPD